MSLSKWWRAVLSEDRAGGQWTEGKRKPGEGERKDGSQAVVAGKPMGGGGWEGDRVMPRMAQAGWWPQRSAGAAQEQPPSLLLQPPGEITGPGSLPGSRAQPGREEVVMGEESGGPPTPKLA